MSSAATVGQRVKAENIKPLIGSRILNSKAELLSGELSAELNAMLEDRAILLFPQLNLTDDEQLQFTNVLGGMAREIRGESVFKVSLDESINDKVAEYLKGSLYWHIDGTMNNTVTVGAQLRTEKQAQDLIAKANIDPRIWAEAEGMYQWTLRKKRSTFGLSKDAWLVCESFKRLWREAHPNITAWWKELDTAVRDAIAVPGVTIECRKVRIRKDGTWLRIGLPSGRSLSYPGAKIDDKGRISYMGVNQYSRQWQRLHTYGGKLAENITQAAARDVLAEGMKRAEAAGYPIVTTIHDELLTAPADSPEFTAGGLGALMSEGMPAWANGLPLAAAGFEDYRYRKD